MLSRRAVIRRGAAGLGACLASALPTVLHAQTFGGGSTARWDVKALGATGRRADNATQTFRAAVEACASAGGGMVYVPPGEYTVGTIQLKDNTTLHLEAGATLFLSQSTADFLPGSRTMIFAENATNIAVTGMGTLDGLAQYVFTEMRGVDPEIAGEIDIARAAGIDMRRYYRTGMQTYMLILNNCRNVLLRDVSILHSPLWNVRLNDCDRVRVQGVYIYSDLEKGVNSDGIDIVSSRNVTISDSTIVTGDDSIVLKSSARGGRPAGPVENVTVTNCILTSSSTPLMIGTETEADISHVLFNNCVIRNSNKGFGINVQDGAIVSDVIFSNLTIETNRRHWNWWGSAEMCKFVLKKRTSASRLGAIRDIVIDNVIARPRGTSTMTGHPDRALENIRMSNVQMFMMPEDARDKRAIHALQVEHARGLRIRDLSVRWTDDPIEAKWQSALVLRDVLDYQIEAFTGRQGVKGGNAPAILLDQSGDGAIANSQATDGCRRFVHVQGEASRDIALRNNRLNTRGELVTFENERLRQGVKVD